MKKILILLLLVISSFYLFFSIRTNAFFSLDDFAVLAYFKTHSTTTMISQFLLYGDPWGFHKILGYLNLRLLYLIFGVNPLAYILNNHFLHTANIILLFLILTVLSKDYFKSFFFTLIFNSIYLFYFSNVHEYLVTLLSLLAIYLFLKKRTGLALICFVLALLSKEIALSLPLVLLSIVYFRNEKYKPLIPFFILSIFYFAYQLAFFPNHTYATTTQMSVIWHNLRFYLSVNWLLLICISLVLAPTRRTLIFLLTALVSLFPALTLLHRQETYYLYLPLTFICLFLALTLPRFRLRTVILYLAVFIFLGGRKLLPPIAHQNFINWQKDSISHTLESIAAGEPLDGDKLERDARLMIETNTFDLFLPKVPPAVY